MFYKNVLLHADSLNKYDAIKVICAKQYIMTRLSRQYLQSKS